KPELQAATVHVPFVQAGVPFEEMQTLPHAPQLFGLFRTFVSQPFAGLASQSANPVAHACVWQLPPVHTAPPAHAAPHVPQLFASFDRFCVWTSCRSIVPPATTCICALPGGAYRNSAVGPSV